MEHTRKGAKAQSNFTGDAYVNMLIGDPGKYDCTVYDVLFEAGSRNDWHRHDCGQILLCTEGIGYFQIKGQPARKLQAGDVVEISANVIHWHGAAPDSAFSHIGLTPKATQNGVTWCGQVSDEEYLEATQ